jgi:hypothetical protein
VIGRVLAVVAASLLVAGCGSEATMGGESGSADAQVTFTPDPLAPGPVTFTVTVTNDTSDSLDLTFPNGQRADVSLRRGNDFFYTWSTGRFFTQEIGHVHIPAGGNRAFTLVAPDFAVPPGTYTLQATVSATGYNFGDPDLGAIREVTVRSS